MPEQLGSAVLTLGVNAGPLHAGMAAARADATRQLQATESQFATRMTAAGKRMSTAGRSMQRHISMPALAASAIAAKLAFDFSETMEKIRNLVGASQRQIEEWSADLRRLGPELGKSPQELAEALYFVASSGVEASEAIGVVKAAAKASALGLGETETVADAVTSAMNAYAKENLSAARATEILMQTVKFGKGEPAELAQSMGRVIPVSSRLGVSFDDVGAAIASLTLQGLDAAEATTALRAIFTTTLKPTAEAEKLLKKVGLSAEDLRESLDEKGTLATLQMLSARFKGNEESIATLFPNVRALVGAFSLTGGSVKRNTEIFAGMRKETDEVGKGFERLRKTDAFKLRQDFAKLQTSAMEIGAELLPVAEDLAGVVAEIAGAFASMPGFARDLLLGAIVLGPAVRGLGALALAIGSVSRALKGLAVTQAAAGAAGIGAGAAAGAGAAGAASAGGVAAGTAAGGGIVQGIGKALKSVRWARIGIAGAGIALAAEIWSGFERESLKKSEDVMERLRGHLSDLPVSGGADVLDVLSGKPTSDVERAHSTLQGVIDRMRDLAEAGKSLSAREYRHFVQVINENQPHIDDAFERDLRSAMEALGGPQAAFVARQANRLRQSYREGFDLSEARRKFESQIDDINRLHGKGTREAEQLTGVAGSAMARHVAQMVKNQDISLERASRFLKRFGMDVGDLGSEFRPMSSKAVTAFHRLDRGMEVTADGVTRETREMQRQAGADFGEMSDAARDAFHKTARVGDQKTKELRRKAGANIGDLVGTVLGGLGHMTGEVNKSLRSLGVKKQIYETRAYRGFEAGRAGLGAQKGGILPGYSRTDDRLIAVRGGEAVLRPEDHVPLVDASLRMTHGVGLSEMFRRTGAHVPARAAGGFVDLWGTGLQGLQGGGVVGLQPGIERLAKWAAQRFGLSISSGLRAGSGSLHNTGEAVDLVPPSMGATEGIFNAFRSQLAELFYDPWGGFDSGQRIGAIGDHMDHIHAAILGGGGPAAMAKVIRRVVLEGPGGPLKDMGQEALDRVRAGANAFIARQRPAHGNLNVPTGPIQQMARAMIAQAWGMDEWSPFTELVGRESGWDPSAVNPSSGAAGLAQALPPSKYPAGAWPYRGLSSAKLQLEWMVDYIRGRYGTPSGALSFHDAHNWYERGGFVDLWGTGLQGLQGGGVVDIGEIVRRIREASEPKQRRDVIQATMRKIGRLDEFRFLDSSGELAGNLAGLQQDAERFGELAERAAQLEAPVQGLDQAGWLTRQLETLAALRNRLIEVEAIVVKRRKLITRLIARAEKALRAATREIDRIEAALGQKGKTPQGWKGVDPSKDPAREWNKLGDKDRLARMHKFLAEGGKLPGDRKFVKDDGSLLTRQSHPTAFPDPMPWMHVRDALRGSEGFIKALSGERRGANVARGSVLEHLASVQGTFGPMDVLGSLPALESGLIGGDIAQVQLALRQLGEETTAEATGPSERETLLEQLLTEANQRFAVQAAQFEVLRAPVLHDGGIVPGRGDVPILARGGEGVFTEEQMAAMGGAGAVKVIVHGDIVSDRRDPVEVVLGDRRFPVAVERAVRGSGRRVLPGQAGALR